MSHCGFTYLLSLDTFSCFCAIRVSSSLKRLFSVFMLSTHFSIDLPLFFSVLICKVFNIQDIRPLSNMIVLSQYVAFSVRWQETDELIFKPWEIEVINRNPNCFVISWRYGAGWLRKWRGKWTSLAN